MQNLVRKLTDHLIKNELHILKKICFFSKLIVQEADLFLFSEFLITYANRLLPMKLMNPNLVKLK